MGGKRRSEPGDPDTAPKRKAKSKAQLPSGDQEVFDVNIYSSGTLDLDYKQIRIDRDQSHGQVCMPLYPGPVSALFSLAYSGFLTCISRGRGRGRSQ